MASRLQVEGRLRIETRDAENGAARDGRPYSGYSLATVIERRKDSISRRKDSGSLETGSKCCLVRIRHRLQRYFPRCRLFLQNCLHDKLDGWHTG